MKEINVVFDIDSVLVGSDKAKPQTLLYLMRKGKAIRVGDETYYVYPGIIALLRKVMSYPSVNVSFFSAGVEERNVELIKQLLTLCLGEDRYNSEKDKFKIRSRHHRSPTDSADAGNNYIHYGLSSNDSVKDLLQVVDQDSLSRTIFVDDDSTYVKYGQNANFLKSAAVDPDDFDMMALENISTDSLIKDTASSNYFRRCNNAFYLAGRLIYLIEAMQAEETKTVSDVLFPIQFSPTGSPTMKYRPNWDANKDLKVYEFGLAQLQALEPTLEFCTSESYARCCEQEASEQEKQTLAVISMQRAREGCSIV